MITTSALTGPLVLLALVLGDAEREWTPTELIAVAEASGRLGTPGGASLYSNTDYLVLGEIIEQVTGAPWIDAVQARIIEPLGMTTRRSASSTAAGSGSSATRTTASPSSAISAMAALTRRSSGSTSSRTRRSS
jgi:CubicO group peptidase (beta-lactamase class C family)